MQPARWPRESCRDPGELAELMAGFVGLTLPFALVAGLAWAVVARWRFALSVGTVVQAVWMSIGALLVTVFAFSIDPRSGATRISTNDAGSYTAAAILMAALAILLLLAARRTSRRDLAVGGLLISSVAAALQFVALSANAPPS
jgi:hypothetical protein